MSGSKITFKSENVKGDGQGVLFGDVSKTKKGLIVIHEWWGLSQQIQNDGEMIAKDGNFVVVVPDFYRGKVTTDHEEAGHMMKNLDWPGAVKDIEGVAKYLLSIGCQKVGVTGFCMGGALAFAGVGLVEEVSAAAPFYGIPSSDLVDLTKVRNPIQAHFGEKDEIKGFSSPDDYNALKDKLVGAGVPYEMFTYPAAHAFTNATGPNYNKECTEQALQRAYTFFQEKLA